MLTRMLPAALILAFLTAASPLLSQQTLRDFIQTPEHYTRVEIPKSGFSSTLRELALYPDREILSGDGKTLLCRENIVAATDVKPFDNGNDVGVDGVVRMWGNHLWSHSRRSDISFPIDNGQVARWSDWKNGMRPKKHGGRYIFTQVTTPNASRTNYNRFLTFVAEEMGAIALRRESEAIVDDSLFVGDLLVSYRENKQSWVGMVLDMCKGPRGEKLYLIGTCGAPSTYFYVMRPYSPVQGLNEWFTLEGAKWAIGEGARVDLRRVHLE